MKCYMFRANWYGQEDSIRVIVLASSIEEAIWKARNNYPGFYYLNCQEVSNFIE